MDSANFINFIKNPSSLHQLTFQELNSLIEAYPYCQNLHFMVMMKAKVEQHKDFEKKLGVVATYCADRKFLFSQIQNPIKPEGTSDSLYGSSEISPVASDPNEDTLPSTIVAVPPTPVLPNDNTDIPEETTHTEDETPTPNRISDQNLDPDIKIVEDESGSQLIIKKADMPLHPEDKKRKVVFLEDLFEEKELILEIPAIEQNKLVNDEIPVESEAPIMDPVPPEMDEPELPLEDADIFAVESDAVSDHNMGIPISEADPVSDLVLEQELPQENLEDVQAFEAGLETIDPSEILIENEPPIVIPDHIIDDIPFEITNVSDDATEDELVDDEGFMPEEAFSDEGNDKISEQSTSITVEEKKIRMDIEEEDDNFNTDEDSLEQPDDDDTQGHDPHEEEDIEELTPLPKIAFKSWPGRFKPSMAKTEENEVDKRSKDLEVSPLEEVPRSIEPEAKPSKEEEIEIEETKETFTKENRSMDLTEVIKKHKDKKKKKAAKAKKKKKAKKEKAKRKQIENIVEEAPPKAKKKKKGKDKKKKKKRIKQLAQKSLTLSDDIISETLAELLVDQGSNKKAIKMYKKLSLIFPEKSAFFAAQIKKLKK